MRTELDAFFSWCTKRFFGAQADPIKPVTATKYADHLRYEHSSLHSLCPVVGQSVSTGVVVVGSAGSLVRSDYPTDVTSRRGMLGWLVHERGVPLDEVSLRRAIPSHQREVQHTAGHFCGLRVTREPKGQERLTDKRAGLSDRL